MKKAEEKIVRGGTLRILSLVLAVLLTAGALITAVPIGASTASGSGYIVLGDVNGDGLLSTTDLTRLMKLIAGMTVEIAAGTDDVNSDGTVNAADLTRLMKYIAQGTTETLSSPDTDGGTETETGTEPDSDTEPPVYEDELPLIEGGEFTVKRIVYGAGFAEDEENAARQVKAKLEELAADLGAPDGTTLKIVSTRSGVGRQYNASDIEIYVGFVIHPEADPDHVRYGDYSVEMIGNKIVVIAYTTEAMEQAVAYLESALTAACNEADGSLVLDRDGFGKSGTVDSMLTAIPVLEDGGVAYSCKIGNGASEMVVSSVSRELYLSYLEKLEKVGYTEMTSSKLAENEFAVFNLLRYTINVGFYANSGTVRIIIEPVVQPFALEKDNVYTAVTTPTVTELGVGYMNSDGTDSGNGACVIFRLSDGRFIIIDGGHNNSTDAKQILAELKRQSASYAKSESDITVAAWILTHGHNDHVGVIRGKTSTFKNINVENVIVNFAHEDEIRRAAENNPGGGWSGNEVNYEEQVLDAVKELGANVRITHPGSTYYLADAKIETLYTPDAHNYKNPFAMFNSTSVVMKITIGNTVYMSLGDATGEVLNMCSFNYGDYLKADIVQVTHHGYGSALSAEDAEKVYGLMAPSTVFWTSGAAAYNTCKDRDYNLRLISSEYNPNIKEVLVSGDRGRRVTLYLPYTPGSGKAEIAE